MSKKKKVDLSTELADLIMGDDDESSGDKTIALPKNTTTKSKIESTGLNDKTRSVRIDTEKSVSGYAIQRGIGAREESVSTKTNAEEPAESHFGESEVVSEKEGSEKSAVKEISEFFSTKATEAKEKGNFPDSPRALLTTEAIKQKRPGSDVILTAEASLVQAEQLRIAQDRILELERVIELLRAENEELASAGEALKNRSDSLRSQLETVQHHQKEKSQVHDEELVVLRASLEAKTDELGKIKYKVEELESRLSGDLKKVRVRERELENRLEIVKLENQAIIKNKDEIILDLKRKIDQLGFELDNYRGKSKELNHMVDDHRDRIRRTVKALRLALSMLEGEEAENATPLKKVD